MELNKNIYYGWWIVGASFITLFGGLCSGFYTVSVFLEPLKSAFGWTTTQLSIGFMASSLFSGFMSPFTGILVNRFGVKKVMLSGGLLVGINMLVISMMNQLWHYYLLIIIQAAGLSLVGVIPCQTLISKWFVKRRGIAMGIIMAGVGSGGMTMVFVANQSLQAFGWRGAYRILAAVILLVVVPVIVLIVRESPESMGLSQDGDTSENRIDPTPDENSVTQSVSSVFGMFAFWQLCTLMFLFGGIIGGMTQHAIAMLNSYHIEHAAGLWALALGISVFGRLFFGNLADRYSKKLLLMVSWICVLVAFSSIYYSGRFPLLVVFFSPGYGLAVGAFITLAPLVLGQMFGTTLFSRLIGYTHLFLVVGIAAGTITMGKTFDMTGSYNTGTIVLAVFASTGFVVNITLLLPLEARILSKKTQPCRDQNH